MNEVPVSTCAGLRLTTKVERSENIRTQNGYDKSETLRRSYAQVCWLPPGPGLGLHVGQYELSIQAPNPHQPFANYHFTRWFRGSSDDTVVTS